MSHRSKRIKYTRYAGGKSRQDHRENEPGAGRPDARPGVDWRTLRDEDVRSRHVCDDIKREAGVGGHAGHAGHGADGSGKSGKPWKSGERAPAGPPAAWDFGTKFVNFRSTMNHYQDEALKVIDAKRITVLAGQAGTAKTHMAVGVALHELVIKRSVQKIILCRPAVEAGERLGYLPGDAKAKVDPYMLPVYDMLDDMVGKGTKFREQVDGCIEVAPVGFLRGRTFKNAFIVLDEAQNCSMSQLKLVMTRLGSGSRMVVTGDPGQTDLPEGELRNPLAQLLDNLLSRGLTHGPYLGQYTFPEPAIVRDDAVREVLKAF